MTLPRFTDGSAGRLGFNDLNDAFGYIDATQASRKEVPSHAGVGQPIIARLSGSIDQSALPPGHGNYFDPRAWTEVEYDRDGKPVADITYRKSGPPEMLAKHPALLMDPNHPVPIDGDCNLLIPKRLEDGTLAYIVVPNPRPAVLMVITGATNLVANNRWQYTAAARKWVLVSPGVWQAQALDPPVTTTLLFNSCESLTDSGNIFGIGNIKPANATVTRKVLPNGLLVVANYISPHYWISVPNGYEILCGT